MNKNIQWIFVLVFLVISTNLVCAHDIGISFYDENTLLPIPTVTITDANGSVYTSDADGLWIVSLAGAKDLTISKTGYDSRKLQFYFNDDANYDFLLNPVGIDSNIGFLVKDSNGELWANKYIAFRKGNGPLYKLSTAWNISNARFIRSFSVGGEDYNPQEVAFKPDGTEMYIIGVSSKSVYQYTLSTAWDISTASFTRSFNVSGKETDPTGVTFKPDGTEMYIIGSDSDSVHQYTLSTAWNISTASFTRSFNVSGKDTAPSGVVFKPDGTEMYIIGRDSDSVHQYALSTAWNISTASFTRSFDVSGKETYPTGVTFKPDGKEMYIIGSDSDSVHQYTLSTAWNISTASFTRSFDVSGKDVVLSGVTFKPDGTEMYIIGVSSKSVYKYTIIDNQIINLLLTSSTGTATANLLANGDYNAILYTSDGNFSEIYVKTTVTVNKPKNEIIGSAISPYDITVGGLLGYSLSNQTASSVSFNVFAGTQDFYYFSVVDYNAVVADRKYIPRQYFVQVPMGSGYYSAITYQPYLLSEIDAVVPKITVLDQFNKPIGEVDVFISRYINNVLTIVESGKTTNTGTLSFSAYPLEYYYINVLYNDVDKGTYRVQPRESTDNFIIVIDTTSTEFITDLLVIDANFAGTAKTVNIDDSNITADVTITQNLNQATSYNLYLMQGNTVKASTTGIISGLTTNISYEFDCSVLDKFNSNIVLKLVINYPDGNQTFYYTITATKNQNGLLYFAPRVINDIGQPLGIILAILITGIILAGLTFSGLNIGSTAIAIMGVLILSVFMFLGWLDVGVKVLGFDIARFFFVLMAFAIVYLVMRGEQYA